MPTPSLLHNSDDQPFYQMDIAQNPPKPAMARRLWLIIRAVYYVFYKDMAKHKMTAGLNLRLLIEKTKLAALSSSCRYVDPTKSFYAPREVEFSCSNTPFYNTRRKKKNHQYRYESAEAVAKAFEMMNSRNFGGNGDDCLNVATPSPILVCGKSPAELRMADSPFMHVDKEAEDFIRRFYQQLRSQQEPLFGRA